MVFFSYSIRDHFRNWTPWLDQISRTTDSISLLIKNSFSTRRRLCKEKKKKVDTGFSQSFREETILYIWSKNIFREYRAFYRLRQSYLLLYLSSLCHVEHNASTYKHHLTQSFAIFSNDVQVFHPVLLCS